LTIFDDTAAKWSRSSCALLLPVRIACS
jgi:hypothetical protein